MNDRPHVLVYFFDAGGGHRATANALMAATSVRDPGLTMTAVSLRDVLAEIDWARRLTGLSVEEGYNRMVRRGFTAGLVPLLRGLQWVVRRVHGRLVRLIARDLEQRRPTLVVSVIPNFNAPLRDAVHRALPGVPFVVLMTDYFDFPPHFWLEPGLDGVVAGHAAAVEAAAGLGIGAERVSVTSGMVLHPRFYPRPDRTVRERVRAELGIPSDRFVFLLLYGGKGAPEMSPLAEALLGTCAEAHVVAIGGDNPALVERMTAAVPRWAGRFHPMGFTPRVAELMTASDLLVTKPGPGTLAEAFHIGLPVIVTENAFTVPQERANARWVERDGLGFVVAHWREIAPLARGLLESPSRLEHVRLRVARLPENRALFEALERLTVLARGRRETVASAVAG